jgi:hypothetical protein
MKNSKFSDLVRNFLVNENKDTPTLKSRLLTLEEILTNVFGRTIAESRRLEIAREQLRSIKRDIKRLEEENKNLQEQLIILQEANKE